MRVAQVCPRYHPYIGGVETHVRMISERLVDQGIRVDVLCTDPEGILPDSETINNVNVRRFRSWAPSEAYYFSLGLDDYLRKLSKEYDIVHAHNYQALPTFSAARTKGDNLLFITPHYHGRGHTPFRSLLRKSYKFVGQKILTKADRIISVSKYEKSLLQKDFTLNENKIEVIPNGVNLREFNGLKRSKKEGRVILSVGRLEKYKGMHHLIKTLPYLEEDITLRIIGKGPYLDELENLVMKMNLNDRVMINGGLNRSELVQMYADADLFALLSTNEAYGITVAEALASGTPCIVANKSGLSEWVDDVNCLGIDVPPDYSRLAELMMKIIGKRVTNAKLFDWDDIAEMLIKSYNNTIKK